MRLSALLLPAIATGFAPSSPAVGTLVVRNSDNVKFGAGESFKPASGGMESTDTPDFFYVRAPASTGKEGG